MEGTKEPESSGVLPALKNQFRMGVIRTGTVGNIGKLCGLNIRHPWFSTSHLRVMLDHPYGPMGLGWFGFPTFRMRTLNSSGTTGLNSSGTTGHPFLKPPPWSSSSRAPLQHPQVAASGCYWQHKKKTPALKHAVLRKSTIIMVHLFHHLWYWWVVSPAKKNPLMTTGTAAKNWDAPTEEVAQLGPAA